MCIIGYSNLLITGIFIPHMTFLSSSLILHISTHLLEAYLVCTWSNHIESFLCTWGWSKAPSVTFPVLATDLSGSMIIGAEIQPNSFQIHYNVAYVQMNQHILFASTLNRHIASSIQVEWQFQIVEQRGNKKTYYRCSENQWEV